VKEGKSSETHVWASFVCRSATRGCKDKKKEEGNASEDTVILRIGGLVETSEVDCNLTRGSGG